MGFLKNLFSKPEPPKAARVEPEKPKAVVKTQRHILDNVEAHMKDIMELVEKNEDYKLSKKALVEDGREQEKIYEYALNERVTLKDGGGGTEPIRVFVFDTYIGDIKKGSKARVRKLLDGGTIQDIWAEVSGGNYKYLREVSSISGDVYELDKLEDVFSITIEIKYLEAIEEKTEKN